MDCKSGEMDSRSLVISDMRVFMSFSVEGGRSWLRCLALFIFCYCERSCWVLFEG